MQVCCFLNDLLPVLKETSSLLEPITPLDKRMASTLSLLFPPTPMKSQFFTTHLSIDNGDCHYSWISCLQIQLLAKISYIHSMNRKWNGAIECTWPAKWIGHVNLDTQFVSSSPTFSVELISGRGETKKELLIGSRLVVAWRAGNGEREAEKEEGRDSMGVRVMDKSTVLIVVMVWHESVCHS